MAGVAGCLRSRSIDLRWILLHLTEETARLDILRELLDGTTGG
jgi:hypothetical protein